jgi:hypothetical protein
MSGPITAPARAVDGTELVLSVECRNSELRLLVTGRASSSHAADGLRAAIRAACRESPGRVVVDLNCVDELDASILGAIVSVREEAADTVIAIDISRLHGPLLLALLAQLLDPGGTVASGTRIG